MLSLFKNRPKISCAGLHKHTMIPLLMNNLILNSRLMKRRLPEWITSVELLVQKKSIPREPHSRKSRHDGEG